MKTPFVIEAKQQTRGSCGKQRENRNRERESVCVRERVRERHTHGERLIDDNTK